MSTPHALSVKPPATLPEWTSSAEDLLAHFTPGKTPRPQQSSSIRRIAEAFQAGKRAVVVEMPTGGGKTDTCKAVANALRQQGGTFMLTSQKILQDQYTEEYPAPDIEPLKGRSNYSCTHDFAEPGQDAADGVCRRKNKGILSECINEEMAPPRPEGLSLAQAAVGLTLPSGCHRCPYWAQLQKCHDASISLFNFSSFLFQQRIGRFPKRALMIVDEAHNVESQLMSFVQVELTEWTLSIVGIKIDREIRTKDEFVDWLRTTDLQKKIADRLKNADDDASDNVPEDMTQVETDALKDLAQKIANFLAFLDKTEWILEVVEYEDRRTQDRRKKIVARPLYAKDFANDLLFRHADRLLFMSATILDVNVWAKNLGLSMDEVQLVSSPCDFPVENRPIYRSFCGNMGFKYFTREQNPKDPTEPKFLRKVQEILTRHDGQRGIIHCHSFSLSKLLFQEIDTDRFLFQEHFNSKDDMLAEHATRTDSVIVAPAMHEGLDLKGDLSRFQVIAKVPWPNMKDRVIKERMSRDNAWFAWLTALKMVQSYGRSVRSKDDWATTYILDAGFEQFLWKNGNMLPGWFKEALRHGNPTQAQVRR